MSTREDEEFAEFDTPPEEIERVLDETQEFEAFGDEEDDTEQVDPYGIPVENVDVHFITKVEGVANLGEAFETASLNLITNGIANYFVLLTDLDSGREWVAHGGLVGQVEGDDARETEDVQLPD